MPVEAGEFQIGAEKPVGLRKIRPGSSSDLLLATLNVPAPNTPLPAKGPVVQMSRFSGSDHSNPGGTSS